MVYLIEFSRRLWPLGGWAIPPGANSVRRRKRLDTRREKIARQGVGSERCTITSLGDLTGYCDGNGEKISCSHVAPGQLVPSVPLFPVLNFSYRVLNPPSCAWHRPLLQHQITRYHILIMC